MRMLQPHAVDILKYRGLGTGIPCALQDWPWIQLADDGAANQSRVVMQRPRLDVITGEVTPEVTPEVARLLSVLQGEMTRAELMAALRLSDEKHFRQQYQQIAVSMGFVEMILPEKPNSRLQKYRLAAAGRARLQALNPPEQP